MADAVAVKKLRDTPTEAAYLFSSASDGTGESAVRKVVIANLASAAKKVEITRLIWSCDRCQVKVLFEHTTPDLAVILAGYGEFDEDDECPIADPGSDGLTGDILFTTAGAVAGAGYTIYMELRKLA